MENTTRKAPSLHVFEDSQSTIAVLEKGNSQKLAHISRTHRVNLHWISEVLKSEDVAMAYIRSADQTADIFTKSFLVPQVWKDLCALINLFGPDNAPLRSNLPVQCCSPNHSCNLACAAALPMPAPEKVAMTPAVALGDRCHIGTTAAAAVAVGDRRHRLCQPPNPR